MADAHAVAKLRSNITAGGGECFKRRNFFLLATLNSNKDTSGLASGRKDDFGDVGAEEPYSEGIIDSLRAVEGSEMVALIREPPRNEGPARRISLRSSHDEVDVSAVARKMGGGGHRQAAGFSSDKSIGEIVEFLRREFALIANGAGPEG